MLPKLKKYTPALVITFLAIVLSASYANAKTTAANIPPWFDAEKCTKQLALKANYAADDLKNWNAVYRWFQEFKQCDYQAGATPEALEDAVAKLLANKWDNFAQLLELSSKDEPFRKFVLSYIGETADMDDLEKAENNARVSCPHNAKILCADIIKNIEHIKNEEKKEN